MRPSQPVIGIDLDNTIINYEYALVRHGRALGFISPMFFGSKREIREHIRRLDDGERKWQQLQAVVYGPGLADAELMPGVKNFLGLCRRCDFEVYVVSHKTHFAGRGEAEVDLRLAALNWMAEHALFESEETGLSEQRVFFEADRDGKIQRIKSLGCTHFIDDLAETFLHSDFPEDVVKMHFIPGGETTNIPGAKRFSSWAALAEVFAG